MRHVLLLLLLCGATFFAVLGRRPLWDLDEAKHAVVAREMVRSGDWVTPRFNGAPFFDKPVLHYWLVAASFRALGINEFAARLPSAIVGTLLVLLTYLLGRRLRDARTGFWAGAVLATNFEFALLARTVVHDISLTLGTTLALLLFYTGYTAEARPTRRLCFLGACAAAGLAVVAKGPVGIVVPGLVIVAFLVVQRRLWPTLREADIIVGICVCAAIALPWYILAGLRHPSFGGDFLIRQNLERFTSQDARHSAPFYYYGTVLLGGFFPWSPFLALAAWSTVRTRGWRGLWRGDWGFVWLWAALMLGFFSLASSKLPTYILPAFPALALIVADFLCRGAQTAPQALRLGGTAIAGLMLLLAAVSAVGLPFWAGERLHEEAGLSVGNIWPAIGIFAAAAAWSAAAFYRERQTQAAGAIAVGVALLLVYTEARVLPHMDTFRSTKELALKLDGELPPGAPVAQYCRLRESMLFYTDRPQLLFERPSAMVDYLRTNTCGSVGVIDRKYTEDFGPHLTVIAQSGYKYVVRGTPLAEVRRRRATARGALADGGEEAPVTPEQ